MRIMEWMEQNEKKFTIGFFAILLLVGLFIRFWSLGTSPLNDPEAANALEVLNTISNSKTQISGEPGYLALTSIMFYLFDANEFFARFWPALFGTSLILLPLYLKREIQKPAFYFLALLITFDPGLIAGSRIADGAMISTVALLFAFGMFFEKKHIISGIFTGVALICSPQFWPALITLGISILLFRDKIFAKNEIEEDQKKPQWWKGWLTAAFLTAVLISSQLLIRPNGLSGIGSTITDYLMSWSEKGGYSIGNYLEVMLITEFPVLLIGFWGLVKGLAKKNPKVQFLGLWWGLGLILTVLNPSRSLSISSYTNIPLIGLAALQLSDLLESFQFPNRKVAVVQIIATISLIVFSFLNFTNLLNYPEIDADLYRNRIIGTLLPIGLLIIMTLLLAWGWDTLSSRSGLFTALGILLALILIGNSFKAALLGSHPENELFSPSSSVVGSTTLTHTVSDLGRWTKGVDNAIDIVLVNTVQPSIQWQLRNYDSVESETAFPSNSTPSIVISSLEANAQSESVYRGQRLVWSTKPDLSQMTVSDWLKWAFYRQAPQFKNEVVLWARNDLFKNSVTQ